MPEEIESWDQVTDEELIQTERDQYLSSLYLFAKYCLGYLDLTESTHLPMANALQASTKRKLICVPRGCFKSSLSTIAYPIWLLLHNPNLRILIDSELYSNSKNFLREIKAQMESNNHFKKLFGDQWKGSMWNEGEIIISSRTKPLKEPTIACSGLGAGKTSQHYDVIIADDLSSYQNTKNPDLAAKTIDHYRLYTSLLEPSGTIVVIGTRYSEIDIIGFVIQNELEIKDGNIQELKKVYCANEDRTTNRIRNQTG